jgi:hypothetical protein
MPNQGNLGDLVGVELENLDEMVVIEMMCLDKWHRYIASPGTIAADTFTMALQLLWKG